MTIWSDTPEARSAISDVFARMKEVFDDIGAGDAYFVGSDIISLNPNLDPMQKKMILCSALSSIMAGIGLEDTHPYSENGYSLFDVISSCLSEKIWNVEEALALKEQTIEMSEWTDPID